MVNVSIVKTLIKYLIITFQVIGFIGSGQQPRRRKNLLLIPTSILYPSEKNRYLDILFRYWDILFIIYWVTGIELNNYLK